MKQKKALIVTLIVLAVLLVAAGIVTIIVTNTHKGANEEVPVSKTAKVVFSEEGTFFEGEAVLHARCQNPTTGQYSIYYTFSGADPIEKGKKLTDNGIVLRPRDGETVSCYAVKAQAKFEDGTCSDVVTKSVFVGEKVNDRFDIHVMSLSIAPEDFDGPKGIYTNYNETGDEWEKPVHVEYFDRSGALLFSQNAGIRIHGGATRKKDMKSYRLYARKEYDEKNAFEYPIFEGATDFYGNPITSYKRLVLRNSGNDNNRCFVRDALAQTLAKEAGFQDTEEVTPVALFINGEYQGFYWAQEYISGKYFKETYGEYEGKLQESDHKENAVDSKEENLEFLDLASLDLTKDENFEQVKKTVDLENYLFYYAINTILDNEDWPQCNSVSYRYYAGDGEAYEESGPFDGRWRFIIHDDDMTLGLGANHAYRECLQAILDKEAVKHHSETLDLYSYSPLFAALMEREDCRQMYCDKVRELISGVFSPDHMKEVLETLTAESENELKFYYKECKYAAGKTFEDYQKDLQKLKDAIHSSTRSISNQIRTLWDIDVRN